MTDLLTMIRTVDPEYLNSPNSICRTCALKNGAKPRDGHVSSYWVGRCGYCGNQEFCCSITDWNWRDDE